MMSKEDRDKVRERCSAATEGPWTLAVTLRAKEDMEFVAHARTDLPRALDALDAKDEEIAHLKKVLGRVTQHLRSLE